MKTSKSKIAPPGLGSMKFTARAVAAKLVKLGSGQGATGSRKKVTPND